MHIATSKGLTPVAQWLLGSHPDPLAFLQTVEIEGKTALHYSKTHEDAELLLCRCAAIEQTDILGMTSLHCASITGSSEIIETLLAWGADVNAVDHSGCTALQYAIRSESSKATHILLSYYPQLWRQNSNGDTALHIAIRNEQEEVVKELLKQGAPLLLQNDEGKTPLHLAIEQPTSDPLAYSFIYDKGSLTLHDIDGNNLLHCCALASRVDWLYWMSPLFGAADLDARNTHGFAPIHIASSKLNWPVAEILLNHGGDPSVRDTQGNMAIHIAFRAVATYEVQRNAFCRGLLSKGARITDRDGGGMTPWNIAVGQHSQSLISTAFDLLDSDSYRGIVFQDALLQAAIGEQDCSLVVAYHKNGLISPVPRIISARCKEYKNCTVDNLFELLFPDADVKEVKEEIDTEKEVTTISQGNPWRGYGRGTSPLVKTGLEVVNNSSGTIANAQSRDKILANEYSNTDNDSDTPRTLKDVTIAGFESLFRIAFFPVAFPYFLYSRRKRRRTEQLCESAYNDHMRIGQRPLLPLPIYHFNPEYQLHSNLDSHAGRASRWLLGINPSELPAKISFELPTVVHELPTKSTFDHYYRDNQSRNKRIDHPQSTHSPVSKDKQDSNTKSISNSTLLEDGMIEFFKQEKVTRLLEFAEKPCNERCVLRSGKKRLFISSTESEIHDSSRRRRTEAPEALKLSKPVARLLRSDIESEMIIDSFHMVGYTSPPITIRITPPDSDASVPFTHPFAIDVPLLRSSIQIYSGLKGTYSGLMVPFDLADPFL